MRARRRHRRQCGARVRAGGGQWARPWQAEESSAASFLTASSTAVRCCTMMLAATGQPGSSMTRNQQNESRIPNVYWRSVSADVLRRHDRFTALPPVEGQAGQAPHTRYVRQDSSLWRDLHDGMLTTGRLKQALGMHEPKAAAVVGIHPGSRGASHLLSAYFHLLATSTGGNLASSSSSNPGSMQAAITRAEAARQAFNAQLATAPEAEAAPAASLTALRVACERAALAGDVSVRLLWGQVQEGAALYSLLQLFPAAQLEEVGLFELQPQQLAAAWGLDPASLPRLGASPDGLIVHKVAVATADLQAAAAALRDSRQAAGGSDQGQASVHAAQQQVLQQLLRGALDAVPCSGTRPPTGVPLASSSDEDDEDAAAAADSGSRSNSAEAGGDAGSSAAELSEQLAGLSVAAAAMPVSAQEAGSLAFAPVAAALLALLEGYSSPAGAADGSSSSGSGSSRQASARGAADTEQQQEGGMQQLCIREVVEVKNHAPYTFRAKRKGKKGRVVVSYSFRPRGPAGRVHPSWIPQLQLHMLATGCQSALLVSRCAEQGVRVFRLWRDDGWLQSMLQLLAVLQTQAVAPGVAPSAQLFASLPGYRPFLQRTLALARGAVCVAAAGPGLVADVPLAADGRNAAKFWPHQA